MSLKTFPVDTYTSGEPVDWVTTASNGLIVRGLVITNTRPTQRGVTVKVVKNDGSHLFDVMTNYQLPEYASVELNFPTLALREGTKLQATVNAPGVQFYASAVEDS